VDLILAEEPNLRRLARRLARCSSDADDLVQDTLLRAYAARDRFEAGTSVRAWTSTILRRVFLTGVFSDKRRRTRLDCDAEGALASAQSRSSLASDDGPPMLDQMADVLHDELLAAFERLPEWYRGPFFLHVVHEMSCREISGRLDIPQGTVMSRIHRARERLRSTLLRGDGSRAWLDEPRRRVGADSGRVLAALPHASEERLVTSRFSSRPRRPDGRRTRAPAASGHRPS
jgi:RNA polymerase sigma-70 factor (ECF subfamily)